MFNSISFRAIALCLPMSFLGGCVNQPKPLYQWGSYQPEVYEYLKGDGKGYPEQLAELERDVEEAASEDRALPPGYRAHMGMLYGQVGNYDKMLAAFEAEKSNFPESATFMDFLLKSKNQKQQARGDN